MNRPADKFTSVCAMLLLWLAFCALAPSGSRAAELLAQANDQTLWIAQVNQATPVRTLIRYRAVGDLQWRELPRLAGKVVDLASRGSSLAVLMDSGEWLLVWPNDYSTGPALPRAAKMIAIASQQDVLYAIGITGGARAQAAPSTTSVSSPRRDSTTAPATSEPSSATAPVIANPPPEKLTLFKFDGASWNPVADLPDDISPATADPSLAVIDGRPMFAITGPDQTIRIAALNAEKNWDDAGTISPGFTVRQFELLGVSQSPLLWVAGNGDAGVIYTRRQQQWSAPVKLELEKPVLTRARAFTFAAGNLRLFVQDETGRLHEQAYQVDGARVGSFEPLAAPRSNVPPGYNNWLVLSALAAALFVMLGSTRKRSADEDPKVGGFPLAPPAMRLLAGLIDLAPIFIAAGIFAYRNGGELAELPAIPMLISAAVYMAHTLIGELAAGRSIGKIMVGLKVLAVTGAPASAKAIVVRNLLRAIDWFPPVLVLILFTPLRQRLGDMVGGTVVVSTNPPAADEPLQQDDDRE